MQYWLVVSSIQSKSRLNAHTLQSTWAQGDWFHPSQCVYNMFCQVNFFARKQSQSRPDPAALVIIHGRLMVHACMGELY